jgi:hypothetical protein
VSLAPLGVPVHVQTPAWSWVTRERRAAAAADQWLEAVRLEGSLSCFAGMPAAALARARSLVRVGRGETRMWACAAVPDEPLTMSVSTLLRWKATRPLGARLLAAAPDEAALGSPTASWGLLLVSIPSRLSSVTPSYWAEAQPRDGQAVLGTAQVLHADGMTLNEALPAARAICRGRS